VAAALWAHVRQQAPLEACGLLLGRPGEVVRAWPARNARASPTCYQIEPEDHFAAIREARRLGLEVIGAFHSHPATAAEPSDTDRAEAFGGFVWVIASLAPGVSVGEALRAWQLVDGNFVEIPLVRTQQE
jgi:[CysO sulfur-carrier protein]-S-L-cysteine hydrolase